MYFISVKFGYYMFYLYVEFHKFDRRFAFSRQIYLFLDFKCRFRNKFFILSFYYYLKSYTFLLILLGFQFCFFHILSRSIRQIFLIRFLTSTYVCVFNLSAFVFCDLFWRLVRFFSFSCTLLWLEKSHCFGYLLNYLLWLFRD